MVEVSFTFFLLLLKVIKINGWNVGKTTLVNILSGLYPTTSGDGKIKGHSVVEDLAKAQRHMGVCPQVFFLFPSFFFLKLFCYLFLFIGC